MTQDVKEFIPASPTCARNKTGNKQPAGLFQPLPTPSSPWSHISVDFVTGLPLSEGNTTILTVINRFFKVTHFIPLPKLPSALETAKHLVQHVFRIHGIPADVVSDRGPQFISQVWLSFCKMLAASTSLTSRYHPQSNGQERCNQELETTLRCIIEDNPSAWSQHLIWVEYAHNAHKSSATGMSPFEEPLGYAPPLFPSQETDILVPSIHHHFWQC